MQDLKITFVQANQIWEDKQANFDNYLDLLSSVNTDLIILPEMFNTGFSMQVRILAENWNDSSSVNWLKNLASDKNAAIYTSLIIQEDINYYNRGVFIYPSGEIQFYDKRKSFTLAKEDLSFSAGDQEVIVEYKGWKIQLQICFDLRFPEMVRNSLDEFGNTKYDLLLYVANWPTKRIHHWSTLLKARAIENQCYVAGVNRIGIDNNGHEYNGCSNIISALGDEMINKGPEERIETVILSSKNLKDVRKSLPFLCKR
tara:strand:- start:11876 stop:12646 length:771 start_codon:yes stop_codon:yes gene_type:complete